MRRRFKQAVSQLLAASLLIPAVWLAPTAEAAASASSDAVVTAVAGEEEGTRNPALPFSTVTFEDQTTGGFAGRAGTETLTVTNEANHTDGGSYALKVEGRTQTWNGPALRVEPYVDKGYEYTISAWVKLISPASSEIQLSTQVGQGDGAGYNSLQAQTISTDDGWVLYEGSFRYNSVGDEFLTIYVESPNNATASFYIDDISFERGSGPVSIQKDLAPIKDVYQDDFLIGNVASTSDLGGVRLDLLKHHHNVITAENAMKPDATQPTKGNFTWSDNLVDGALAQGLSVHGHVLVWHQQTPAWMNTSDGVPLGREEALGNLRTHIKTVVEHYGDRVISWDVVNEAMNDNPSNPSNWKAALRKSAWYNAIGEDYVEQAFLAAREVLDAHPEWDIKLYYNDYNDDNQNKAQAIYSMVKELNDKYAQTHPGKLLVDGIGMQAHYSVNTNPNNVKLSLEKFISLGVEVSVTELDIQAGSDSQLTEKQAIAQGYLYAQLFQLYQEHADHIARVTFWGLNDATSWRSESNPLLFDKDLQAKPAYYGVVDPDKFIEEHPPTSSSANQGTATYATPVVDGTVDAAWSQAPAMAVNRYQTAWQGASGTARALWDDQNLYVLIQVNDAQLDKTNANAWEQDSIEIFLDQNNAKVSSYQDDDGQYRVNFDNETSFNPESQEDGFASAVHKSATGYTVEAQIPLDAITAENGKKLGFDVQINDAKDGIRQSVAAWNDTTGTGYMDPSTFGVLTLSGKADQSASPVASLQGKTQVNTGDTLELTYGLKDVQEGNGILAQDLIFTYDPAKLQFIAAESLQQGTQVIAVDSDTPGEVRVLMASEGPDHAITADGDLLKIKWKAIDTASSTSIELPQGHLANADGEEVSLAAAEHTLRIVSKSSGDLNEDGRYSIGDLAMAAAAYGKKAADPDWNTFKQMDLNNDGVIDIIDLSAIASLILQ
ncbi:endo-1,4-beta-xylanase [Paenibacillus phyllosphaerae]|uniref:Beta-xylanase n=1 Tax=Paenibacillus phyllosphaerae TaxID=274593 RepID=A0A7W5ASP3_9BACL|nr:endo-1,4-beta-xylanase [Paenibacillus phyllosphaerae]MBB3108049.1 endo-1,4-beta-xylanase [Paenibacillus phyllosphaerae]